MLLESRVDARTVLEVVDKILALPVGKPGSERGTRALEQFPCPIIDEGPQR